MKRILTALAAIALTAGLVYAAEINDLNITDASNIARFPENMAPSDVNDGARELEAIIARWHEDTNGSIAATGNSGHFVFAAKQTLSAYYDGQTFTFDANHAITGASGLNVDSIGEKTIKKHGDQDTQAGDIEAGQKITVRYDGTNFQLVSALAANQVHTIWIPAGSMVSTSTSGAASGTTELPTNDVMLVTKDYDKTQKEYAQATIAMPTNWDTGSITPVYHWTAASGSGTVQWYSQCLSVGEGDAMDAAFGTAAGVTDTLTTFNDNHRIADTVGIKCSGTAAAQDMIIIQVYRDTADSLGVDAKLIGVKILYGTDATDDR